MKVLIRYTIYVALVLFVAAGMVSSVWNKTPVRSEVPVIKVDTATQIKVSAKLVATNPGEYKLIIQAFIPNGLHICSITNIDKNITPTIIELDVNATAAIQSSWSERPVNAKFIEGVAEWVVDIRAFDPQVIPVISGTITVGPCSNTGCLMPQRIRFTTN